MKPNEEVKKLIELGRDHIIELAIDHLQKDITTKITKDDFHFITVKASNKRVLVNFGYNVIYLPKNTSYYSDFIVELPSRSVSKSIESNEGSNTTFYHPTQEHLAVINFIKNPNGNSIDVFNKGIPYSPMFIYEEEKHYLVEFSSRDPYLGGVYSTEEIHKETGKILSSLSGHYEPAPIIHDSNDKQEIFVEIKE